MADSQIRNEDIVGQVADIFKLMGDQTRLRILLECLDGEVAVGGLVDALGLSQSLISHHLRLLRAARLVRHERRGKNVFYAAADDHVRHIVRDMMEHAREEVFTVRHGARVA